MITQENINKAIDGVEVCIRKGYKSAVALETAKRDLAVAKTRAIAKGVEGKNAEERKANLEINLTPRQKEIEKAQEKYNEDKIDSEIAHLELTWVKLSLRLMELISKE